MALLAPAELLRSAREQAGLSQRELARLARTAQSVVARIESGASPNWATLVRLLRAAGFDLDVTMTPAPVRGSHMLADVPRILALTPEQRLLELESGARLLAMATPVQKMPT